MNKVSYIVHMKEHKDSKGDAAPWVVKSHEDNKILSSHKTESEAKKHLQQMHIHSGTLQINSLIKVSGWADEATTETPSGEDLIACPRCTTKIRRDQLNLLLGICHNCAEAERSRKRRSFGKVENIDELIKTAINPEELSLPLSSAHEHPAHAGFGSITSSLETKLKNIIDNPDKAIEYAQDALQLLDALYEQFHATIAEK
jgi:hypothetical protein